ncbi:RagB/SusD family nutrient uptake outer membrane protein [Flavobacterium cellulosilyticum]|uniref:RagB/SusD family nutrient uptake outer membrane protein n=1 Tax=Flavobacterium cellulosilyticum TaxID=2541731 RepID=A0A4R5C2P0_9FLAO|nr:RagB/SusD family nutrient uptake outer membrane protein [Flavobacterium cellulosilyticum]TDD93901.1 RagB/SusD family nutrient uptake outer membrane protein [Flavobacterium cellulosilyticum]
MNNFIKKTVILLIAFSMNGCSDFLDPNSLSTYDTDYLFSNLDDARKATNSIYASFGQDAFRSRLSSNMQGNTDIEANGNLTSTSARYELWGLRAGENNSDTKVVWEIAYKAIRDSNIVIDGIHESKGYSSNDIVLVAGLNQLLGEAYTLRAYWYSMLIFTFGDVPFIKVAPKAGVDFNLPKEDRNVILSSVIQDMIDIEPNMKWADQLPYGIEQVNREFTLGMIARLSLQRGGYSLKPDLTMARESDYLDYYAIARDYSNKLITLKDRALPVDFGQIFRNECEFITPKNSDVLFEVPFAIGEGDVAWNIGIRVNGGPYGTGSNYMNIPATYYYSFDFKDKRRDVTCGLYERDVDFVQQIVSVGAISQGKWSREWLKVAPGKGTSKGTGINWPLLRYSDVLLMYAESVNEISGPTAAAKEALSRVRKRAFDVADWPTKVVQYVTNVSASKGAFFNAIVDERAWEFGGELTRKSELIRWNLYDVKIKETVEGLHKLADDAYYGFGELPDYIWAKNNIDGTLTILNRDYKQVATPADPAYIRYKWLIDIKKTSDPTTYNSFIETNFSAYTFPVKYISPIPAVGIVNSLGVLKNDGYGFTN